MTELRVLHVIAEMGAGGAEALVRELVRAGDRSGWTSAVASAGGFRAQQLADEGVPQFHIPMVRRSASGLVRAALALRAALQDFRPVVIVGHNVSASAGSMLADLSRVRRRVPLVTVLHGVADEDYPTSARILRRTSDVVVVVASDVGERLRAAGLEGPPVVVVRNAVSPMSLPDQRESRSTLGLQPEIPVVLCLARMEPEKRHDVLLDAWARVREDAVLLLVGDGSLRQELELRSRQDQERGRILFLGSRSDVPTLLSAADITVLTSDREGLPVAILESLAAGRPVVATDVGGVGEVLRSGGGRLVPPGQPQGIAEAIDHLLFDARARSIERAAGLAMIESAFDPNVMIAKYDEILRSLADKHRV